MQNTADAIGRPDGSLVQTGTVAACRLASRAGGRRTAQALLTLAIVGLFAGRVQGSTTATNEPPAPTGEPTNTVQVIPATETLLEAAGTSGESIRLLIETAQPTIGVPYEWGGVDLETGVDCSGYTWQLLEKAGAGYDRYLDTRALSGIEQSHGLRKIPYEEAAAGDLLVYGYFDETNRWRGHVVILIDKDGETTGHKGLVLGAHGPPVDQVQFITFTGFEEGYYRSPQRRLRNVLRVQADQSDVD